MIIISDSTVLINFALLSLFDKLHTMFGDIIVPKSVFKEVFLDGEAKPGSKEILEAKKVGWIIVEEVIDQKFYCSLKGLHKGEREAVTLAYQYGETYLLTDDGAAIRACKRYLPLTTCFTTFEIGEAMYKKGVIGITHIEMAIRLKQLA